ncbi:uncharacterized protein LOC131156338 [Malania oleifera]|uniref:uncharacterized protein LOC131156338 n=1 Tax=Malania oleifera TaxID=397392 RepID=UPI0025AE2329|nr:uncharacterized protein LOC131156338 [Malania oleifera]XP_057965923.1 uncharacterized protein LOC131156338 [Malania oleifera]XP_057965924.1 uncharacterized protein LOC131156338 [Malania oleifera]XP_057965925.1 uncharacterized protein LOC131156338 [Malania oleifera]
MATPLPSPPPPSPSDLEEDYSPSSTVITFPRPLPLLRVPTPASSRNDRSAGPFVLAFPTSQSFGSAFKACESKIVDQCEGGARIGCAISASSKCKPPWWQAIIGGGGVLDLEEREKCEEREMGICVAASKEKCLLFAKEKCLASFRDARVALNDPMAGSKKVSKLIFCASMSEDSVVSNLVGIDEMVDWVSACEVDVTNYRGSVFLDSHRRAEKISNKGNGSD